MIETIYIEEAILQHPRVIEIIRVFRKQEKLPVAAMAKFLILKHKIFDYKNKSRP